MGRVYGNVSVVNSFTELKVKVVASCHPSVTRPVNSVSCFDTLSDSKVAGGFAVCVQCLPSANTLEGYFSVTNDDIVPVASLAVAFVDNFSVSGN
jgi:hypothetical protein